MKDVIALLFDQKLLKTMKIDYTDHFCVFFVSTSFSFLSRSILMIWMGIWSLNILISFALWGVVLQTTACAKEPQQFHSTCDESLSIYLGIPNLFEYPKLEAVHIIFRLRHNDDPAYVTYAYIKSEIISILADRKTKKANKVAAEI
jgi:hypothetical protein